MKTTLILRGNHLDLWRISAGRTVLFSRHKSDKLDNLCINYTTNLKVFAWLISIYATIQCC